MMPLMKNQKERTDDAINEHTVTRVTLLTPQTLIS